MYSKIVSRKYAKRRVLQVKLTFMVPEYRLTSERTLERLFSRAIVGSNFESRNLILLTRDWTTCKGLSEGKGEKARSFNLIVKRENNFR